MVFKGEIFEVYQWEQSMFDGSKAIFERLKRPNTVGIIPVTEDGKLILIHEEQPGGRPPFPSIAGGRMEEGEEPEEAIKRELLKETGYQCEELILWKEIRPVAKMDWTIYTFIGKRAKKVSEPKLDPGERIQVDLVSFDEFVEEICKEDFYSYSPEVTIEFLKAKADPEAMQELRNKFVN